MYKVFITFISAIFITSCATAPHRQKIEFDWQTPEAWASTVEMMSDSIEVSSTWWEQFGSPELNQIIDEAFVKNLDLLKAATNLEIAQSQKKIATAGLMPHVNLSANGSKRKQNFIGLPIPNMGDGILSTTSETYNSSMSLSWELDLWGRLRADRAASVAQFQSAQADYLGAKISIAGRAAKAWFAAITTKQQLDLSQATYENWKLAYNTVSQRYEKGLSPSLEMRLITSNLKMAEANLASSRSQYEAALRQLEILVKHYPSATTELSGALPSITGNVPAGIPADIISRRPDLAAAELKLASANLNVKSAKRALYPQISLTASGGTSTDAVEDLLNGDFGVWSLAGNILQPIFQGGRLRANVKISEDQAKIALADFEAAVLNALSEVETALSNEKHFSDREQALKKAAELSKEALKLAESQYSSGVTNFLTMLESARSAYEIQTQYLTAKRQRLEVRVDLYLALGGGFSVN